MVRVHISILVASLLLCCFYFPVNSEQGRDEYSNRLQHSMSLTSPHNANATTSFKNNLGLLLSDFTFQSSLTSFYNASKGETPDQVYAYYMCRGDITRQLCDNCILNGTKFARRSSPDYVDGTLFSEKCMFQYSNHSMYGLLELPTVTAFDYVHTNVSNYQQFNQTLSSTIEAVIDEAASKSNNSEGSMPGFVTKEAIVSGVEIIYSLAQCTPDIVGENCSQCLRTAFSYLKNFADGAPGAVCFRDKCQLRYDNTSFYGLEPQQPNKEETLRTSKLLCFAMFLFTYYSYLVLF